MNLVFVNGPLSLKFKRLNIEWQNYSTQRHPLSCSSKTTGDDNNLNLIIFPSGERTHNSRLKFYAFPLRLFVSLNILLDCILVGFDKIERLQ